MTVVSVAGAVLLVATGLSAAVAAVLWPLTLRRPTLTTAARAGTIAAASTAVAAMLLLQVSLVQTGPLPYAVRVTTGEMPVYYRMSAMWAALEGSLLLWLVVLAVVSAIACARPTPRPGAPIAAATLTGSVAAFAVVSLLASPFSSSAEGAAPNPLLQDHVAMGVHPPLLYIGFATTAVPYAWAVAAAMSRETVVDGAWTALVRRWSLVSWCFLTAGIALGAWWSYAVLGWGGYWAWDPVENASALPWLTMTALLHVLLAGPVRGGRGVLALAGAGFVLVVLAQFLTRSGSVQSIHAFSDSPFGPVLAVMTLVCAALLVVPLLRHRHEPAHLGPLGRAVSLQAVLMVVLAAIVLVGTVLPTILVLTTGRLVSVGPPWYERTLAPVALAVLVLLAVGPWLPARGGDLRTVATTTLHRMRYPLVVAAIVTGVVALLTRGVLVALAAGLVAHVLTGLIVGGSASRSARRLGSGLAHLGVAVAALAVLAGAGEVVREQTLAVGDTVTAGATSATLVGLDRDEDGRRIVARAQVALGRDGRLLQTVHPELRWYESHGSMLTGPAIRSGAADDVYVTLLDVDPQTSTATVRLAVTPLVSWLWVSAGLLVLGGVVAALPRRGARSRTPRGDRESVGVR